MEKYSEIDKEKHTDLQAQIYQMDYMYINVFRVRVKVRVSGERERKHTALHTFSLSWISIKRKIEI